MLLIENYHDSIGDEIPNPQLNAIFHAVVENQIAMGEEIPARTLRRLMDEGLDRHEAIHAVGSVLAEQIYDATTGASPGADISDRYARQLESLTAEEWRNSC